MLHDRRPRHDARGENRPGEVAGSGCRAALSDSRSPDAVAGRVRREPVRHLDARLPRRRGMRTARDISAHREQPDASTFTEARPKHRAPTKPILAGREYIFHDPHHARRDQEHKAA